MQSGNILSSGTRWRRSWEDLATDERDRFLLAAFGGAAEWQGVMESLDLDRVAAGRIAAAMCPVAPEPRTADERRQREQGALAFLENRPLGIALRDAIARRDGAGSPVDDSAPAAAPLVLDVRREARNPPAAEPAAHPDGLTVRLMRKAEQGIRQAAEGWRHRPSAGGDEAEDLVRASLDRWQTMGEVLKAMTVESARRGYPPALNFIRIVEPYLRPQGALPSRDGTGLPVDAARYQRIRQALGRSRSPVHNLYRRLFPPQG